MKKVLTKKTKCFSTLFIALILLCAYALPPNMTAISASAAETPTLNSEDVTIYALNDSYNANLSIPSDYITSFKFSVSGTDSNVYWYVKSGSSVNISDDGVITPKITTWYWNGNIGSTVSSGQEGETVTHDVEFGESVIAANVDGVTLTAKVKVENYASVYAENVINEYINENISETMTDMEKLEQICKFVASYDYSVYASAYVSMIVTGGGDCWASTDCINHMCDLVGLKANERYAANDSGAGSGHRNSVVLVDGETYLVDAGYSGTAPRYYSIKPMLNGLSYKLNSDSGYTITQYDGFDNILEIPSEINGKPVTKIASSILYYNQLYNDIYVTDVYIPETVNSISTFAFSDISELKSITVSEDNPNFSDIDGVLFSKDKKTLIYYPNGLEGEYIVPSSVEEIGEYAFYYSQKLTSVTIPNSVKELKEGAFGDCSSLQNVKLSDNLETIDNYAFYYCSALEKIVIPPSVQNICENAFDKSEFTILGYAGTYAETYASEKNFEFIALDNIALAGDLDGNGKVNIEDATYLQRVLAQSYTLTEHQTLIADVNGDGTINVTDVTSIQRIAAGLQ